MPIYGDFLVLVAAFLLLGGLFVWAASGVFHDHQSKRQAEATNVIIDQIEAILNEVQGGAKGLGVFSVDLCNGIAIREHERQVCFIYFQINGDAVAPSMLTFTYSDILAVEIIEDGFSLGKTQREDIFSRALIGGIVAGPVGAIVGGLSGPETTHLNPQVSCLALRILVNDLANPVHTVVFLNRTVGKCDPVYSSMAAAASLWNARLSVIIQNNKSNQ